MSTFVIGDIQGCYQALKSLVGLIQFDPTHDKLWCVGDLVNRGPGSLETLQFLYQNRSSVKVTLGNHDLHLLALYYDATKQKKGDTLTPLLAHPQAPELIHWLRQQPLAYYSAGHDTLMVHAGVAPNWSLNDTLSLSQEVEQQLQGPNIKSFLTHMYGNTPEAWSEKLIGIERLRAIVNFFTRVRALHHDGRFEPYYKGTLQGMPDTLTPWFHCPTLRLKDQKIVFGHWAALNGTTGLSNIINLDTGCVWGNRLTALRLEDGATFSVPSQK